MEEVYRVTFKNQLINFWPVLIPSGLVVAIPLFSVWNENGMILTSDLFFPFVLLAIVLLPQVFVHLNYYYKDFGKVLFYNNSNRSVTINQGGESYDFLLDDIVKVERFSSPNFERNQSYWFPWDGYHHSIINIKDGSRFLITSLMCPFEILPNLRHITKTQLSYYRLASTRQKIVEREVSNSIPSPFIELVEKKSDEELKAIIDSPKEYSEDFIRASKCELNKRRE